MSIGIFFTYASPANPTVSSISSPDSVSDTSRHKSYHPYLEKNKERVRQDEARAQEEEIAKEQKRVDNVGTVT